MGVGLPGGPPGLRHVFRHADACYEEAVEPLC
jgi:hypothetical protein